MTQVSEFQQKRKAENMVERLALQDNLNSLRERLSGLFRDTSIDLAESTSIEELEMLIAEIKQGTATNNRIARFLELADKLGIS